MKHQTEGLVACEGKRNFAFLMEQGTGKTWLTLADVERCFIAGKIDALLVVAPKGVHTNWVRREIPTHLSVEAITAAWRGRPTTTKDKARIERLYATHHPRPMLRVFAINIDALNTEHGHAAAERFLETFRTMMVVDESTRIKNPASKRTKKTVGLGRKAEARRILSGTPLTKAPTDLFSQFDFLKPGLLGTTSYRAFMAEYAVLVPPHSPKMQAILRKTRGRGGIPQVVETDEEGNKLWKNLDRLRDAIKPHSFRVRKDECLDLPPKVYKTVTFELTPKQRVVYDRLKEDYAYVTSDFEDMSFQAIAARTKMKQVTSGFIFVDGTPTLVEEDQASSPRMEVFKELIEDVEGQFIVWAMFEEELNQIAKALDDAGISNVLYYGKTRPDARERAIDDFQAGKVRVFVGHAAAAGIGLTLTAANTAIYYSCSYDNELRMQSEDRCHRIGTVKSVLYIDIIAEDTIDEDIARSLQVKTMLADFVIDGR
ncbi:helicase [Luteibacter phage vB_LflM-Pluto]|uniref:Helicase n=1 Tax=Luteibacter phage vB_LflM-Pluto TaxID=2948611 RepID=A0A9E7SL94_9CAUD|nr:helicase [Luteibacter phage vB_LflM-Pluto]